MCPFSSLASRTIVLPVALSAGLPMCMYWTPRWTVHVHVLLKSALYLCKGGMTILCWDSASNSFSNKYTNSAAFVVDFSVSLSCFLTLNSCVQSLCTPSNSSVSILFSSILPVFLFNHDLTQFSEPSSVCAFYRSYCL